MQCPYCLNEDTKVLDSRDSPDGTRRRRECEKCEKRFTTYERVELVDLRVVKKDGTQEQFNRDKLKSGLLKAVEKRPVSIEQIDHLVSEVERDLRNRESTEIKSSEVGELVMEKLKELDPIAYIRFASVYMSFDDVKTFEKELKQLKKELKE
ncbi:transcriptional repressor NrdR [Candidatus Micrarchaeota archaeon]|nr:transcriptional repressor NrdR [Candidatus Micrarchaeota archaeon]